MKPTFAVALLMVVGLADRTEAANFAVITAPPTILNLIALLLAVGGVVVGLQLLGTIRGGYLSRAWQILVAGFVVLALGQAAVLLEVFEVVVLPVWVAPSVTVLWAGVFFYGVFETKRVLA